VSIGVGIARRLVVVCDEQVATLRAAVATRAELTGWANFEPQNIVVRRAQRRALRRKIDRLVEVLGIDDVEAAELLATLCERSSVTTGLPPMFRSVRAERLDESASLRANFPFFRSVSMYGT